MNKFDITKIISKTPAMGNPVQEILKVAALELVDKICDLALLCTDSEMQKMSWSEFVSNITEPELIQYLKERNIYINEEINAEEEL